MIHYEYIIERTWIDYWIDSTNDSIKDPHSSSCNSLPIFLNFHKHPLLYVMNKFVRQNNL